MRSFYSFLDHPLHDDREDKRQIINAPLSQPGPKDMGIPLFDPCPQRRLDVGHGLARRQRSIMLLVQRETFVGHRAHIALRVIARCLRVSFFVMASPSPRRRGPHETS